MKSRSALRRSAFTLSALLGLGAILLAKVSLATTYTWAGNGTAFGETDWSDPFNWANQQTPVSSASTDLVFGALAGPQDVASANEDIADPFMLDSLTFSAAAPAYTLSGGTFEVGAGGINNSSANTETIDNAVTLTANSAWTLASGAGALTMNGGVNTAGNTLILDAQGTGNVFNGAISGPGSLSKQGLGTVTLTGTSTYSGGTSVLGGTLVELNSGAALGTGTVAISTGATVSLDNTSTSSLVSQGPITFQGAGTLQKTGAGTVQLGGNGGDVNVSLNQGGVIDVEAGTLDGSSSYQGIYTNNKGSLNIAAGATFNGVEGTIIVDALTGAGTLMGGYGAAGSVTIGVAGGSGTFSGNFQSTNDNGGVVTLIKAGSGTEILTGTDDGGGTTTINGGTLQIGNGGQIYGNLPLGTAHITDNALLVLDCANDLDVPNTISGSGSLTQSGTGTVTLIETASYTGITTVSAGTLAVEEAGRITGSEINVAGAGATLAISGTGTVNTGGVNALAVDGTSTSAANVTLSDTATLTTGQAVIGVNGLATFTQRGGTFSTNGNALILGDTATAQGAYTMSGGSLSASSIYVGYFGGSGSFSQTGGAVTTNSHTLYVADSSGSSGTYTLGGGTLTTGSVAGGQGTSTFNFNGGTLQAAADSTSFVSGLTAAYVQAGAASIDPNGYSVTVSQPLLHNPSMGTTADGGLTQNGAGTLTLAGASTFTGPLVVNGGTTVLVTGATLTPTNTYVGYAGTASFTQTGGSQTVAGELELGIAAGASGTYTLSGGALTVGAAEIIGGNGNGSFVQSGGTNNTGQLQVGPDNGGSVAGGAGTYTLNGGSLTTGGTLFVGIDANGTFNQSGGTVSSSSPLLLGYDAGVTGTYNLNGGVLSIAAVQGNEGTSFFHFNGGTLQASTSTNDFFAGATTADVRNGGALIDTNGNNITANQPLLHSTISGDNATDGGLTKLGLGTLTLTGANTYTGATMINAGALLAANTSGSATGTGAVTVNAGGTLGGYGTISGPVTVAGGGTLSPSAGLSPSRLHLGNNLTLNSGSTLAVLLGDTSLGSGYDQVQLAGQLTLAGNLSVSTVSGFKLAVGQTFVILDDTGTTLTAGVFANTTGGYFYTDAAGDTFLINYLADADGGAVPNDVSLTVLNVVPEPGCWPIMVSGAMLAFMTTRRRRLGT